MTNAIVWTIAAIVVVLAWFYERASREVSLVKTGIGGRKVVLDGGIIVIPYFQQVSRVNMQTLRLDVGRTGEAALITRDRLRVDVGTEFHLAVAPTEEGVARASQTLGRRTFNADQLRELIEGVLVDALRAVAARSSMDELHENRGAFVAEVRDAVADTLARHGLELESVSLTALDQTPFAALDENNAFNAVGMRRLAEVIARARKERAEIDADAEVSVREAAMQATKRKLRIDLEEQEAQIAQVQEIEILKSAQLAEVARRKAEGERAAAQARIAMEQQIRAADIASEQAVREAEIAKEKRLKEADMVRERELQVVGAESEIVIAAKSVEESSARAAADAAKVDVVKAAEAIATAQRVAEAERELEIALIAARQKVETAATLLRTAAQSEAAAAEDRTTAARADADAERHRLLAEAEGRNAMALAAQAADLKLELARLEAMPKIVAEMVKPAEKIDSIRIHRLAGFSAERSGAAGGGERPAMNQVIDSIMEMAVQLPALKKLGEEMGLSLTDWRAEDGEGKTDADD